MNEMKKYKGLLFLDIDGTFFRWSLFLYMVDKLIESGIFNEKIRADFYEEEKLWKERKGSYDEYLYKVIGVFENCIAGVSVAEFERLGLEMVAEYKDQIYRFTRELVNEKKKKGWYVVAISLSPQEAVKPFAEAWGMNEFYSTEIEVSNGKYTGMRNIPRDKASIAKKVMERPEFAHIPPENIWGIGDSEGDVNFLEIVGHPICFNPTLPLYQEAQKRGWNVVVERKNVIYEI